MNPQDLELSLLTPPEAKLQIIAEPKAFYRERYCSETDPKKNRAQRFIRSEDEQGKHEYPTIQIPSKWRDPTRDFYIRVTLVTITSKLAPEHCVHPYAIDTQEPDVIRDAEQNSLFFPITKEDMQLGEKRFDDLSFRCLILSCLVFVLVEKKWFNMTYGLTVSFIYSIEVRMKREFVNNLRSFFRY